MDQRDERGAALLIGALPGDDTLEADPVVVRILDAAATCYGERGIRQTSMDAVARSAGVGRATVYRRFRGRDELTTAVLAREAQQFFAEIGQATEDIADVGERLIEGLVIGLRKVRELPLLQRLLHTEPELALPAMTLHAGPALATIREFLAEQYRRGTHTVARPGGLDPDEVAEILVRLAVSLTLTPETVLPLDTDEQVRATARRYLSMPTAEW